MVNKIRVAGIIFFIFICIALSNAQDNSTIKAGINQIIPTEDAEKYNTIIKYPKMRAYITVRDKSDNFLPMLIKANFDVAVDGKPLTTNLEVESFFYTKKDPSVAFFILINTSGVMMGFPLESQKKAVKLFIDQLREQDTVSVYKYSEKLVPVFEYQTKNDSLYEMIDGIEMDAGSSPKFLDSLRDVVRHIENEENKIVRNVIIALSEGRDSGSMQSEQKVFDVVDTLSIPIYSVGIPIEFNQLDRLDRLAKHTGGVYMLADGYSDIAEMLKIINNQVINSYVLEFKVNMKGDDAYHTLHVNLNFQGENVLATKLFYAPKAPPTPWWFIILIIAIILIIGLGISIFIIIIGRGQQRKKAGTIHKNKCKECGRIQKDDWNECLFCKYMPQKKESIRPKNL